MISLKRLLVLSLVAPLLGACANGGKLLSLEPDAKQGDLEAVAADLQAIKRDQQGLVNAQADVATDITTDITTDIRTELNGVREMVTNNATPREAWVAILVMLGFSNLDQVGRFLTAIRRRTNRRAAHPP